LFLKSLGDWLRSTKFGGYGKSDSRLALKAMEFHQGNEKPVMCEVVQNLQMIKTSWKKRTAKGAAQVTGTDHIIGGAEDTKADAQLGSEVEDSA
jgi:hypothetical protein